MKNYIFGLVSFLASFSSFSQDLPEQKTQSKIQEITLFLNGAQVFEKAETNIPTGESTVVIKGLSPYLEEKSIQVKAMGNFTIQAVNKRMDYLTEDAMSESTEKIQNQIYALEKEVQKDELRLSVLAEKISLLDANKKLGGSQSPTSAEFRQTLELYDTELMKIKTEQMTIQDKIAKSSTEIRKLENQINAIRESTRDSKAEIRIRIKAQSAGKAQFEFNYLVANAGWFPKYDVRVKDVNSPMTINYKAEVFQNTGVDWKDVKLRFSNGNPNQSGVAPDLDKWNLNYARLTVFEPRNSQPFNGTVSGVVVSETDGAPIPGVSVLVKGTSIGTVTDVDGRYSITIPSNGNTLAYSFIGYELQETPIRGRSSINISLLEDMQSLNEIVVTGYGATNKRAMGNIEDALQGKVAGVQISEAPMLQTTVQENQTTVEIEVTEPYSIKTNGERTLVDLKAYEIPAKYQYKAIPKLDNDAFLIAQISDWNQYSLLEGESNLYFEDGFVGRSILNAASLEDTLSVSMGRDRSIVIQRQKVDEFAKKRTIGSNITENRGYEITVRNNKSQAVELQILDQIPVSVNSSITVEAGDLSGGKLNEETGIITWNITIPPGSQQKLIFQYEVKYPKNEKVILD
ncbi:mucoidy inhibitor MuiA family protein [Algoriphagus vanfongensis]|uniref:mucoidy inhibitor MuiA family protein n=1 Tax=Algoriphagus vanfongensis TaxID=426371 RepID=UPI000409EABE|nr:mucoidy inhibitor MuiA family protein [Algoriphagus vanfongensis]